MPEVSFYVLSSRAEKERQYFACKLVEKAYRAGQKIYVLTDSENQSRYMDDLLWTFRAGSFIPHQIYSGALPDEENPVVIGSMEAPETWRKTIINLSARSPEDLGHTEKLLEILDDNEDIKTAGRNRYRYYQKLGFNNQTHKI